MASLKRACKILRRELNEWDAQSDGKPAWKVQARGWE
jgi:hypothetical protein